MRKLTGTLSGEKKRMHKVLTDGGVRLAVVVSDIHGKSAREMIKGLLRGERPEQVLQYAIPLRQLTCPRECLGMVEEFFAWFWLRPGAALGKQ